MAAAAPVAPTPPLAAPVAPATPLAAEARGMPGGMSYPPLPGSPGWRSLKPSLPAAAMEAEAVTDATAVAMETEVEAVVRTIGACGAWMVVPCIRTMHAIDMAGNGRKSATCSL